MNRPAFSMAAATASSGAVPSGAAAIASTMDFSRTCEPQKRTSRLSA
jgi:hypothetical protein